MRVSGAYVDLRKCIDNMLSFPNSMNPAVRGDDFFGVIVARITVYLKLIRLGVAITILNLL